MNTDQNAGSWATTATNSLSSLPITTPAKEACLPIGTERFSRGLETLRNSVQAKADAEKINNQLRESLRLALGSQIAFHETTNRDFEITNCKIVLRSPMPAECVAAIEYLNRPARSDVVAVELTRLKCLTARRKEAGIDLEASTAALTEELRNYPEDVVRTVCRNWARKNVFFPVLKELIEGCESLMMLRRALLTTAKGNTQIEHKPSPKEEWVAPTDADKAAVAELVGQALKNCGAI